MTVATFIEKEAPDGTAPIKRQVLLADVAGFCFGVRRAVEMTQAARSKRAGTITTLGPLVHNSQVTEHLKTSGVEIAKELGEIGQGTVIVSAHGSAPIVLRQARDRGLAVLDVTCPFVSKVHRSAKMLVQQGYQVLLVGDPGHTEVKGVMGAIEEIGGSISLVSSPEQVANIPLAKKVGVVSQTTQSSANFAKIVSEVCKTVSDVRALNTVCNATEELQEAAIRLARKCEVMLVVGGRQSANTRRLRDLCEEQGIPAFHIEAAIDIDSAWLDGKSIVGLTAGASTPDWMIEDVARTVNGGSLPADWKLQHPDE
jgi:(E)-4-hydroxy-3-methyl-but-2-enyl pyrophosphate reductase